MKDEELESVWKPTVLFLNSVKTKLVGIEDAPNRFWYKHNAGFWWTRSFLVSLSCVMDFSMYPFDSHDCTIKLALTSPINFTTLETTPTLYAEAASFEGNEKKLRFKVKVKSDNSTKRKLYNNLSTLYPQANVNINVRRKNEEFKTLLSEFYLPTWMFSKMALISYSIPVESVPGRIGLLVTLYLITTNIYVGIPAPTTRGFGYLDMWISGMLLPIEIGIIQYGILLSASKFGKGFICGQEINFIKVDLISFGTTLALSLLFDILYFVFWIMSW